MRNARTRFLFSDNLYQIQIASPRRQRTAAVRRSRFWLRYFPTGVRPTQPQRPPYPPLKRATKQTGLDKHRSKTYPFRRLRRHETGTGVHLPRHLHLYLQRSGRLRPLSPNLPQQQRRRTIPRLHPHRPDRPTKRDDRHPRQSVVLRRIDRLGSSERGNQGNGYRLQNQYYKGTSWEPVFKY